MLTAEVQETLRENELARRLVGVLLTADIWQGFYGKNPIGIPSIDHYFVEGHEDREVDDTLRALLGQGFLNYTIGGCGPGVYSFKGEEEISKSDRFHWQI